MAYNHKTSVYKKKNNSRRLLKTASVLSIIFIVVVSFIAYDWFKAQQDGAGSLITRSTSSAVQSAYVTVYRTPFYQFQAADDWVLLADSSNEKKFVYVKQQNTLYTQRLTIFIDRPVYDTEADVRITNTLPVGVIPGQGFTELGTVSTHCRDSWPSGVGGDPIRIVHEDTSFICHKDSAEYNVVVAEKGADEVIGMNDAADSEQHTITIVYSNLTAYPSPGDLYNILNSFTFL